MTDPELHEDQMLAPYQRELFPKRGKRLRKKPPTFKSRGQVHGYSRTPFDSMQKSDWLKEPSGEIRIEYE